VARASGAVASDPGRSTNAALGMTLHWTAVNAIASGNTGLVVAEAHRVAAQRP